MMSVVEFFSQPVWHRLSLTLVHFLWQGLAAAVIAYAAVRLLRMKRGNPRYGIYLLAFALMAICPLITFAALGPPTRPTAIGPVPMPEVESPAPIPRSVLPDPPQPASESTVTAVPAHRVSLRAKFDGVMQASLPWALVGWMGGVLILSVRLLLGFVGVCRWRRHLEPLSNELNARVALLSKRLGMPGFSRIFTSHRAREAVAMGYLRPMVLLPAAIATQMTPEMLEAVIAHELAHIRRLDLWVNLAQRIVETLLFYHPAVWWLSNRLRAERELCCDEMAVAATGERLTYASALETAQRGRMTAAQPTLAMALGQARRSTLRRVRHILGLPPAPSDSRFWLAGVVAVMILALLAMPAASLLCAPADAKTAEADETLTPELTETPEALARAAAAGDVGRVEQCIARGADVNLHSRMTGMTPLHWTAMHGQGAVAALLLADGARVDATDRTGRTALHLAAARGHREVASLLLSKGADVRARDDDGHTPLFEAMSAQGAEAAQTTRVAELLISKGADVSPIHRAAFTGDIQEVQKLLDQGVDVNARDARLDNATPLYFAVTGAQKDVIRVLLAKGADLNAVTRSGETALYATARCTARTDIAALLIEHGANVNFGEKEWTADTPLHAAAFQGHIDVAKLLIAKGANVHVLCGPTGFAIMPLDQVFLGVRPTILEDGRLAAEDLSPDIRKAARDLLKDRRAVAEALLAAGAHVNRLSSPALMALILSDGCEMAELLFAHGLNPNGMVNPAYGTTLLHAAATAGSKGMVELLLAKGTDVNVKDRDGGTPLWYATDNGHTEVAKLLLEHGAGSETPARALLGAARSGNIETVRSLMDAKGADVNIRDYQGRTPLCLAAARGHTDIARLLITQGADVNVKSDTAEATALIAAIANGHRDIVKLLVANGADVNARGTDGHTALHYAVKQGDIEIGSLLVSKDAELEAKGENGGTALALAAYEGRAEFAEMLIENGANTETTLSDGQTTPLCRAVARGHSAAVKVLLAKGAKVDMKPFGRTLVHVAMQANHPDLVRLLLTRGLRIPAIHEAAYFGETEAVRTLLAEGVGVNTKDEAGYTPLHCALCGGHDEIVGFLRSQGADVNARTADDQTPLCFARTASTASLLIADGADVNARAAFGHTVLHTAVNRGHAQIVELLLAQGAEADAKAKNSRATWLSEGWTPLHVACRNSDRNMVELLVARGADIYSRADGGDTPVSLARESGAGQIINSLVGRAVKDFLSNTAEAQTYGGSLPKQAPSKFTIPKANLEIAESMQSCAANLQRIYRAIRKYEEDRGKLPDWLSDLVPEYLSKEMLLCPYNPAHNNRNSPDPKMPCSYGYQFSVSGIGGRAKGLTSRQLKTIQMRMFGDVVPLVRCRMHGQMWLALTVDGRIYLSPIMWERLFIPDYDTGQGLLEDPLPWQRARWSGDESR